MNLEPTLELGSLSSTALDSLMLIVSETEGFFTGEYYDPNPFEADIVNVTEEM